MSSPVWDTSSAGTQARTRPDDQRTLAQHRMQCMLRHGRWVTLRCGSGRLVGYMAARLVTSVALLAAVVIVAWLAWRFWQ